MQVLLALGALLGSASALRFIRQQPRPLPPSAFVDATTVTLEECKDDEDALNTYRKNQMRKLSNRNSETDQAVLPVIEYYLKSCQLARNLFGCASDNDKLEEWLKPYIVGTRAHCKLSCSLCDKRSKNFDHVPDEVKQQFPCHFCRDEKLCWYGHGGGFWKRHCCGREEDANEVVCDKSTHCGLDNLSPDDFLIEHTIVDANGCSVKCGIELACVNADSGKKYCTSPNGVFPQVFSCTKESQSQQPPALSCSQDCTPECQSNGLCEPPSYCEMMTEQRVMCKEMTKWYVSMRRFMEFGRIN